MTYTLITANRNYSSWSLRPWLLMKALGIPFAERFEPFTKPDNYENFRKFSPTGQVPVLIHGDRTIADSLAIALYLGERHEGIWPAEEEARVFAQGAVCEMHGGFGHLRNDCTMNVGVRVTPKPMSEGLRRNVERVRELFETGLSRFGGPWLAGADFSAVDAFYAPVAFRVRTYGLNVGQGQRWVDHVLAHPAMQQWEAEALAEDWREEAHEAELAAAGVVTADYRK
ncbi:glutathione S-transferase family protein [Novosphingobium sp.]|uniref:glutathione S-transferase family protein n=1 Tax=Novosphingobium sp. TaxID=1874826 RepID=UPI0035AE20A5